VIDPTFGQVIDYGATRYRPPSHLADLVIARDGTAQSLGPAAAATTDSNTKPAGTSGETRTARRSGPHLKDANTPTIPPARWKIPGE